MEADGRWERWESEVSGWIPRTRVPKVRYGKLGKVRTVETVRAISTVR